jgi:hypothetical protein
MTPRNPFSTPEDRERYERQWRAGNVERKRLELRTHAHRATGQAKIDPACKYLSALNSEDRIGEMLDLIEQEPAEVFWPIFVGHWWHCDRTFEFSERLIRALRRVGPYPKLEPQPKQLTVYRGSARSRIASVSWTTDIEVARRFAAGHRGIPVPDPVVAMAEIGGHEVFWTTNEREESEIICTPRRRTIIEG